MVCQVLKNISKCVHVLEDQVMKDKILGKGLMLKFFTPKSFKTWKAKSWIAQSLSRLGNMVLQKNVTFQNLGYQVLKKIRTWSAKSWQSCSLVFMSWKTKSWKFLFGSNVEILYPKRFQDLESQVLNRAIIVKTWGHGVAKNVTTFQNLGYQVLKEKCKNQTCGCQVLTIMFTCVHVLEDQVMKVLIWV